jgi:energy-converting hydrogenase Eha subunit A/predicted component of type VI protein secretion system
MHHRVLAALFLISTLPFIVSSHAAPVELLVNGDFAAGIKGWTAMGGANVQGRQAVIVHEGGISQTVERPDLSFFLELSYEIQAVLYNPTSYAGSWITCFFVDQAGKSGEISVVGYEQRETDSSFRVIKVRLIDLVYGQVENPETLRMSKVVISLRLAFQGLPLSSSPSVASFRSVSLKRVNPVKFTLKESCSEFEDRTELNLGITNMGDLDATNVIVSLDLAPSLLIVSEKPVFERALLEAGTTWKVSWTLKSRLPGRQQYSITIRIRDDQAETELPIAITVIGPRSSTATTSATSTSQRSDRTEINGMLELVVAAIGGTVVALLIGIPILRRRRRSVTTVTRQLVYPEPVRAETVESVSKAGVTAERTKEIPEPKMISIAGTASETDSKVYDYIVKHEGTISLSQAARDLKISLEELQEAIYRLRNRGRLA